MKMSKEFRILDLYHRLCEGKEIRKCDEAVRYGVSEKSVQRDIETIRSFLSERMVMYGNESRIVIYKRESGLYCIVDSCRHRIGDRKLFFILCL